MLMLPVACCADVFRDAEGLLMLFFSRRLYMSACRPVACLALNVFHMRCFFHRNKTAWLAISGSVTGNAFRIVFLAPHLQNAKVSGVLPFGIWLYMLRVTILAFHHSYIVRRFRCFFVRLFRCFFVRRFRYFFVRLFRCFFGPGVWSLKPCDYE